MTARKKSADMLIVILTVSVGLAVLTPSLLAFGATLVGLLGYLF